MQPPAPQEKWPVASGQWSVLSGQKKQSIKQKQTTEIIRDIVIPEIEREVNEGSNFAQLRQIYQTLILAAWFKQKVKKSFFGRKYVNQNKVWGVDVEDKHINQKIYQQY